MVLMIQARLLSRLSTNRFFRLEVMRGRNSRILFPLARSSTLEFDQRPALEPSHDRRVINCPSMNSNSNEGFRKEILDLRYDPECERFGLRKCVAINIFCARSNGERIRLTHR
jgi:hypothetical protein